MRLVIRAESMYGRTVAHPVVCSFDAHGGTIGRAEGRSMVLADPERVISRLQAELAAEGEGWRIRNAGANAIFVNARQLGQGESCALAPGDKLRIGAYVLGVSAEADDSLHTVVATPVKPPSG